MSDSSEPSQTPPGGITPLLLLSTFVLGISVGISLMFLYMQVRNPDPMAELKKAPQEIRRQPGG
ncbi:MAG: hypothetical protein SFY68_07660 [Candidatus Sumerlaeia bacterium]|nr:hypothetical protein [Candidatus Sumerlaeia bacterium]